MYIYAFIYILYILHIRILGNIRIFCCMPVKFFGNIQAPLKKKWGLPFTNLSNWTPLCFVHWFLPLDVAPLHQNFKGNRVRYIPELKRCRTGFPSYI